MASMKNIALSRGYVAIIDDEDFEKVSQYKWHASQHEKKIYAKRKRWIPDESITTKQGKYVKKGYYKTIALHRVILDAPDDMEVDHINGNPLDCRKINLRVCSHEQNMWNLKGRSDSKSGYRGITWDKQTQKWRATLTYKKQFINIGRFDNLDDAIKAHQEKAKELFGEFTPQ